jgi:PAS domain S-box-containing protein
LFLGAGLLMIGVFAFGNPAAGPDTSPALLYAPIPLLIWAALRFGFGGASASMLVITSLAIWETMHGRGPFLMQSPAENALALQLFLLVTAIPLLFLAVLLEEEKRSQSALRESEVRFRNVADTAPVLIWMSGPDKEGIFFNKGWLEFTGRREDQEMGEGWLKGVHPEDLPHCLDICGTAFGKQDPFTVEYRLLSKDGEYRWMLDTGTPRFEADGTFLGYIGSCIDIGERKQTELDHQLQSMELARVGRLALMGELAASLAHEVNNPLGAMVTNASAGQRLLSHGQLKTEELRELLADIVADGHRAGEVIQGIRNMVRKGEASHALVDMQDVIRDLLRIVRADAIARNVSLVAQVEANAGIVLAHRVQLLQVLLNLTMNSFEALAAMRADARRVIIRAEAVEEGRICVSVRDTGPGFPAGMVDQLFEAFFSTKQEGTGMGLAIARSIIEAHGGTLSGENCEQGGALFTICLPEATETKLQAA